MWPQGLSPERKVWPRLLSAEASGSLLWPGCAEAWVQACCMQRCRARWACRGPYRDYFCPSGRGEALTVGGAMLLCCVPSPIQILAQPGPLHKPCLKTENQGGYSSAHSLGLIPNPSTWGGGRHNLEPQPATPSLPTFTLSLAPGLLFPGI